eukprot:scaffold2911_cov159-Skeletonema_dohrnii-CCMP3373.AAC.15
MDDCPPTTRRASHVQSSAADRSSSSVVLESLTSNSKGDADEKTILCSSSSSEGAGTDLLDRGLSASLNDYTIDEESMLPNSDLHFNYNKSTCDKDETMLLDRNNNDTSAIRLSVAHPNDKNDSDASLSFREFRRNLSILKRSLQCDDSDAEGGDDYGSTYSSDEASDEDDEDDDYVGEICPVTSRRIVQQTDDAGGDDDRPSLYALGTSMRSMRCLTRKTKMPVDEHSDDKIKRRKKLNWLKSFYRLDPRWQICNFFDDLAYEGVGGIDEAGRIQNSGLHLPPIMRAFSRVGVFSVWRPTSNDAIRRMITGEGTGKGMDIKGKSATRGKWSGYVPFLQIHHNEDKIKVGSLHADARVRVFYPNKLSRDRAFMSMTMVRDKMVEATRRSMRCINEVEQKEVSILEEEMHKSSRNLSHSSMKTAIGTARRRLSTVLDYSKFEAALEAKHRNDMIDAAVYKIDDYVSSTQAQGGCYGLDIPEKLFWEAYVSKADISREAGSEYDNGRPSMPEFQVMNLESLRKTPKAGPRPVLWHAGCGKVGEEPPQNLNPLCPFGLLMAYEEGDAEAGKVTPVVSDFDCFLVGTRGVEYRDPLGEQELSILKWCVDEIEGMLDNTNDNEGEGACWTRQWLDVKKKYAFDPRFQTPMPKMGYADPRSSALMKGAVYSLRENGAVRHGPECFNYSFPQPLDDKYLVISDTLPGLVPWKYVDIDELMEILADKIDEGFAFPLNPKWILCDEGWKDLYDKLLASEAPNVQDALNVWYPADVRARIDAISSKHPIAIGYGNGPSEGEGANPRTAEGLALMKKKRLLRQQGHEELFSAEIAELELERYKHARRGKGKLRRAVSKINEMKKKMSKKKHSFFSIVLLMLQIGIEADAQMEKGGSINTGRKKMRDRLRRRSSVDSSDHSFDFASSSFTSAPSERSASSEVQIDGKDMHDRRPSHRRSLTRYIRKRLSLSKKKSQSQSEEEQSMR